MPNQGDTKSIHGVRNVYFDNEWLIDPTAIKLDNQGFENPLQGPTADPMTAFKQFTPAQHDATFDFGDQNPIPGRPSKPDSARSAGQPEDSFTDFGSTRQDLSDNVDSSLLEGGEDPQPVDGQGENSTQLLQGIRDELEAMHTTQQEGFQEIADGQGL